MQEVGRGDEHRPDLRIADRPLGLCGQLYGRRSELVATGIEAVLRRIGEPGEFHAIERPQTLREIAAARSDPDYRTANRPVWRGPWWRHRRGYVGVVMCHFRRSWYGHGVEPPVEVRIAIVGGRKADQFGPGWRNAWPPRTQMSTAMALEGAQALPILPQGQAIAALCRGGPVFARKFRGPTHAIAVNEGARQLRSLIFNRHHGSLLSRISRVCEGQCSANLRFGAGVPMLIGLASWPVSKTAA